MIQFVVACLKFGDFAVHENGTDEKSFCVAAFDQQVIVFGPDRQDAHVRELDAGSSRAIISLDNGEFDDKGVALFAGLVGCEARDVIAGLIGKKISERKEDDGVAPVAG